MKVKLERDECLTYFVHDNPQLASRWMIEMTEAELADFKQAEEKYFAWQNRFDEFVELYRGVEKRPTKPYSAHKV